jgi:hypothetical protein
MNLILNIEKKLKSSLLSTIPDFVKASNGTSEAHYKLKNSKENSCKDSESC